MRVLRELGALRWVYDAAPRNLGDPPEMVRSIEEIWDDQNTFGVVIATPPETHRDITIAALRAGKHVLVEKPMAMTLPEIISMKTAAERAGTVLMVGHLMRYHEGYRNLLADMSKVGKLEYLYSHRLQQGRVQSDISCLWSLAPHDVDMMIGIAGMPVAVSCTHGPTRQPGIADIVTATMEFKGGVRGHIFISWLHSSRQRELMVIGADGAITMDQHSIAEPLKRELIHFIDCIKYGEQPMTGVEAGLNVVRVLSACATSMRREGERIWL